MKYTLLFYAVVLSILTARGHGEEVPRHFEYLPEHQIGGMKMTMGPRRYVEVSWKGRMLFSQGGEVFTQRRIGRDSDGIAGRPVGVYSMDDRRADFDMPVDVEATDDRVSYTWILAFGERADAGGRGAPESGQP